MRSWVLAFLLGDASLLFFSSLPSVIWAWLLFVISIAFLCFYFFVRAQHVAPLHKLLFGFVLGFAWGLLHASNQLALQLPMELESKTLTAIGTIANIPEPHGKSVSFEFVAQQLQSKDFVFNKPIRIRLSWYNPPRRCAPPLQGGDQKEKTPSNGEDQKEKVLFNGENQKEKVPSSGEEQKSPLQRR